MNFKIRAQRVLFNETADWLIGVKFQCGFKVTIKCATPCLCYVRANAFVKFLICFHSFFPLFFFQPPWMMIPLCVRD